ncbi:hypothetical protein, partial [Promicromonospora kroppenstedtii]|uniref:hypothetical protein n=1 Tax=Promicromonospora kroppenstedtii TaxID=440482 RepID=UPI00055CA171
MSDTPAQIRALYDTDPDRDAYEAIAEAVDTAITARDHLIHALTARALETGGQVAAIRAFADRHRNRPGEVSAQGMVRMLDNIVGKSDAPIVAELPRARPSCAPPTRTAPTRCRTATATRSVPR